MDAPCFAGRPEFILWAGEIMNNSKKTNGSDINLADILKSNKSDILEKWEAEARSQVPAAKNQSKLALLNSLPEVIDKMIETLSASSPHKKLKEEEKNLAIEHGKERASLSEYSLDQVIMEFNILREVIFEFIDPDGDMTLKQGKVLWDSIFIAIRNSASEYSKNIKAREEKKLKQQRELEDSKKILSSVIEQKTTEIIETEINYKSIIDNVGDYAVFTLDPEGVITSWNAGCIRMKGYSVKEAIGRNFSMLYPEEANLRDEPQAHLSTAKEVGRYRGEGARIRKNGEVFMADVYIIPQIKGKKVTGYAKIVADMTEHNKLVQDRNLSLSESLNLKEERKLRESFVSTITHDLRNPLAAAQMSAEIILRNPNDNEKHLKLASKIVDHLSRTDKMILDLLDANRINAGRNIALKLEECNLTKLAHEVCEELSSLHGDRIKLRPGKNIIGFWDCSALKRILENLTTNALKYGDNSTEVTISLEEIADRVHMKVHNFGKVIELPDQAALFEQFHRSKDAETGTIQGWGLGLTLVKGLVEAHKGMVKVESYPEQGTTFTVDLPLKSHGP
jgi:PAS domain S-box-containing protein